MFGRWTRIDELKIFSIMTPIIDDLPALNRFGTTEIFERVVPGIIGYRWIFIKNQNARLKALPLYANSILYNISRESLSARSYSDFGSSAWSRVDEKCKRYLQGEGCGKKRGQCKGIKDKCLQVGQFLSNLKPLQKRDFHTLYENLSQCGEQGACVDKHEKIQKLAYILNVKQDKYRSGILGTNDYDQVVKWRFLRAGTQFVYLDRLKRIVESGLYSYWAYLAVLAEPMTVRSFDGFQVDSKDIEMSEKGVSLNSNIASILFAYLMCCGLIALI